MAKVRFTRDFCGVATAEQHYQAGAVVDLPEWSASRVVAEGAAVRVVPEKPPTPAPIHIPVVEESEVELVDMPAPPPKPVEVPVKAPEVAKKAANPEPRPPLGQAGKRGPKSTKKTHAAKS